MNMSPSAEATNKIASAILLVWPRNHTYLLSHRRIHAAYRERLTRDELSCDFAA
jgi:hypothetical protein